MTNLITFKNTKFGVADKVKIVQKISESGKERRQIFLGTVIKINGDKDNRSFTVRRLGANMVGIEKIFPLNSTSIEDISVTKQGIKGARKAKLYFVRHKSKRQIDKLYSRNSKRM